MHQLVKLLTRGTVGGEQVSKHGGDKRNAMTQLMAIPKESVAKVLWTIEGLLEQGCGVQKGLV